MIIEYFYLKYKKFLFTNDLPLFICKLIFFYIQMYVNESISFEDKIGNKTYIATMTITLTFQLIFQIYQIYISIVQFYLDPNYFKRTKNIITTVTIISFYAYIFSAYYVAYDSYSLHQNSEWKLQYTFKFHRTNNCIIIAALVLNCFTFLELSDDISPFVDIFYQIFYDIRYFMLILIIYGFAFANVFWILSKNQISYDKLTEDEISSIDYATFNGALWYIWYLALG